MQLRNVRDELIARLFDLKLSFKDIKAYSIELSDYNTGLPHIFEGKDGLKLEKLLLPELAYDSGFGGQYLFGWIVFKDDTWLERNEYDGSEWWEYKEMPTLKNDSYEKRHAEYTPKEKINDGPFLIANPGKYKVSIQNDPNLTGRYTFDKTSDYNKIVYILTGGDASDVMDNLVANTPLHKDIYLITDTPGIIATEKYKTIRDAILEEEVLNGFTHGNLSHIRITAYASIKDILGRI